MLLSPLEPNKKKKSFKFATMDIEAYEWIKFLVIGFYDGNNNRNHYKHFTDLKQYADYVYGYCNKYKIKTIFGHFAGKYDFNFLLKHYVFDKDYEVDCIIPRGSSILSFEVTHIRENFTLVYRDSSALLPFGLASLCDAFKVEVVKDTMDFIHMKDAWDNKYYGKKLEQATMADPENPLYRVARYELEYDKKGKIVRYYDKFEKKQHEKIYNREDILFYLEKDCISLWQVIDKFYAWPLVQKAGPSTTTASQAVKIWRLYLKDDIHSIEGDDVDSFIRQDCYYGGRTEVFRPFFDGNYNLRKNELKLSKENKEIIKKQKKKKLQYVDVNSLYPTVMRDFEFPSEFDGWAFGEENYKKLKKKIGFWEVEVEVADMIFPPLPLNHTFANGTKKLIFPVGTFRGKWSSYELEYAKKLGVKIKRVFRGAVFKSGGKMFQDFIVDLYNIRLQAKKNNDSVNDLNSKLIMNSCYGRLGLQTDRTNLVLDDGSDGLTVHSEITNDEGETIRFMERAVSLDKSFTNVAISAMVTSYARVLMHKLGMKIGPENLYYMDTDSFFTDQKCETGPALGQLKLEYEMDSACFLLPKTYINDGITGEKFTKKLTMKGFDRKKITHFTIEDFKHALRGDMERLSIKQEPKFATLKTALRHGEFLMMNFDPETKKKIDAKKEAEYRDKTGKFKKFQKDSYPMSERKIKSRYDKRVITNQGLMSRPIKLVNGKEEA